MPYNPKPRTVLMAYHAATGDVIQRIFWTATAAQAALDWLVGQGFNAILIDDNVGKEDIE